MVRYGIDVNVHDLTGESGYSANFAEGAETLNGNASVTGTKKVFQTISKAYAGAALGRQVFSGYVSRRGMYTGSADVQQKWDFWTGLAAQGFGVGMAFGLGGPAAGIAALAAVGVSYAFKVSDFNYEKEWEGIALQEARRRAGPSLNRSRL